MKIIILNNLYKPYTRGGAEVITENTALALSSLGHEVTVISTKPYFSPGDSEQVGDIRVIRFSSLFHNLNSIPKPIRLFWHLFDILALRKYLKLRKIIKSSEPDLLISNNLKGLGYSAWLAGKATGAKVVHILHDINLLHPSGLMYWKEEGIIDAKAAKVYQAMNRLAAASVDLVISPSAWLLDLHISRGLFAKAKQHVLPNPAPHITEANPADNAAEGLYRFIYIGQLESHKGIDTLVNAFGAVYESTAGKVELAVLGTGTLERRLRADRNQGISFFGYVEHDEAMRILSTCDCLVLPSKCYENSPTVIYEALSSGVNVIASRIGGIPELVDETMLFEPEDTSALANLMDQAAGGKVLENQKNAEFDSVSEYALKLLALLGK